MTSNRTLKIALFSTGITLFMSAAWVAAAVASPPVIRAIDRNGERIALPVLSARPAIMASRALADSVPPTSTTMQPDTIARMLDERTPDEIRTWLLQQGEVDQGIFAPASGADPLRALTAPDPFAAPPVPTHPRPHLSTPIAPDAPATQPVIRGTLTNPVFRPGNTPTRLPPHPTLTSAPTSRGRRIAPSPQAKQYASTARLNPTAYSQEISQAASRFRIDPALVRAVVHVESGFNPKARSDKGASGLMQLMPATARQWGVTAPHDARQNITGGSQHLAHLLSRYNGNTPLALAAYNAGEGAVDRYGGIPPYRETIDYAAKVMTLWNRYRTPVRSLEIRSVHSSHPQTQP